MPYFRLSFIDLPRLWICKIVAESYLAHFLWWQWVVQTSCINPVCLPVFPLSRPPVIPQWPITNSRHRTLGLRHPRRRHAVNHSRYILDILKICRIHQNFEFPNNNAAEIILQKQAEFVCHVVFFWYLDRWRGKAYYETDRICGIPHYRKHVVSMLFLLMCSGLSCKCCTQIIWFTTHREECRAVCCIFSCPS